MFSKIDNEGFAALYHPRNCEGLHAAGRRRRLTAREPSGVDSPGGDEPGVLSVLGGLPRWHSPTVGGGPVILQ